MSMSTYVHHLDSTNDLFQVQTVQTTYELENTVAPPPEELVDKFSHVEPYFGTNEDGSLIGNRVLIKFLSAFFLHMNHLLFLWSFLELSSSSEVELLSPKQYS